MKIAYMGIKGLPSKGGAERVVEAVVERLKTKSRLTVYCSEKYTREDDRVGGVELMRLPCSGGKHLHSLSLFLLSAFHALVFGDYDLVHVHNAEACFVVPFLKFRYPVIATSHGPAYARDKWGRTAKLFLRLMDRLFILFPDLVTSVSLPFAEEYERKWQRRVHYTPNGVDNVLPADVKAAENVLKDCGIGKEYLLFAAGRVDRTKGCHDLLDAFSRLEGEFELVVVGDVRTDPEYTKTLQRLAGRRVHFIPFIADKRTLFGILKKARLFIFPSTVEAMSMALLEAASLGVPIVCSDISANLAVLPCDLAVYFRAADPDNLKERLEWALSHPEEMVGMGEKAQEWVRHHFSWDTVASEYETLYRSLIIKQSHDGAV